MGVESFKQVFAPSAQTLQRRRDEYRKAAWGYLPVAIALAVSTAACTWFFMNEPGETFAGTPLAKLTFAAILFLAICTIVITAVMLDNYKKADELDRILNSEYLTGIDLGRIRTYN